MLRRTVYLLLMLVPALLFADEVHLHGGAVFSGRIVEQTETMVTIDIGDGEVGLAVSRIERIVKASSPLDEYDERAALLQANDVNGWRSLGLWASNQGLSVQSRQAYQKVIDILPDDPEARSALGYVLHDGRWLTEEESYRARGYVKQDGEWMTRNEAQRVVNAAAADQSRLDAERRANVAEADNILAESRTEKAQEEARQEERTDAWSQPTEPTQPPVYWGSWGVSVSGWPSTANVKWRKGYQPARSQPINPKPR